MERSGARTRTGARFPRFRDPDYLLSWPRPQDIIESYLEAGEFNLYADYRDTGAWVWDQMGWILLTVGISLLALLTDSRNTALMLGVLGVVLLVQLLFDAVTTSYTRYVLTNKRIIRFEGFASRSVAAIPWDKVTDVSVSQTVQDRAMRTATIVVHSSGVESLKKLEDLNDWRAFYAKMNDIMQNR